MAKLIDLEGLGTFLAKLKSWATAQVNSAKSALQANIDKKADKTTTVNGHALSGNVTVSKTDVGLGNVTNDAQVKRSEMGVANGVATLGGDGKVPSAQLPAYVDDVMEFTQIAEYDVTVKNETCTKAASMVVYSTAKRLFIALQQDQYGAATYYAKWKGLTYYPDSPMFGTEGAGGVTPESNKIYVDRLKNKCYRWSGSDLVEVSSSLALGTTSSTAFRGDWGNTAYQHATKKGAAFSSGLYKITTNDQGHVTAAAAVSKSDITALGIPSTNTTYGVATTSSNGLMSAADKAAIDLLKKMELYVTGGLGYLCSFTDVAPSATQIVISIKGQKVTSSGLATGTYYLTLPQSTQSAAGLMSAADKKKLDGYSVATTAEVEALFN